MAYLKVITGPMFSGKTEILIRLLDRAVIAEKRVLVVKPTTCTRTGAEIAGRSKSDITKPEFTTSATFPAHSIGNAQEFWGVLREYDPDVLAIDEAQFFDSWIYDVVVEILRQKANADFIIYIAGLDLDAWRRPFGAMPQLIAIADDVQKETAICFRCHKPAHLSQILVNSVDVIKVDDGKSADVYEARCRICHQLPPSF